MNLKYPALLASLFCGLSVFAQESSVIINEVDADTPGDDAAEFVELYDGGVGNTPLDGLAIVFFNGSDDKSYKSFDLDGEFTNANGYFVLGNPGVTNVNVTFSPGSYGALQNGADAVALIVGNAVDFPNDTPIKVEGEINVLIANKIIDAVVYDTNDSDDSGLLVLLNDGQPQVNESKNGASDTESNQRCANGSGGSRNTNAYQQLSPTPGTENICGADVAPLIASTSPADADSNVAVDANISLTFSEPVTISGYNSISCDKAGTITVTETGEGTSYVLNPDQDFESADSCSFTINATDVTDLDGTADNMAEDYTMTFTVVDNNITFDLVINEFLADPASGSNGDANGDGTRHSAEDEFVEIVNFGDAELNLSDWKLSDGYGLRHVFPSGTVVEPGCAVVVFGGGAPEGVFGGALVQTASRGQVGLNNGGDTITLTNGSKTFEVVYGSEGGSNQSLTLNPDVTGESFSKHSEIPETNGALFSPGTKLDGSKFDGCTIPDIAPEVVEFKPADSATQIGIDSKLKLIFSEPVNVTQWPDLVCEASGNVGLTGDLSGTEFTLIPANDLNYEESCTFTLPASSVTDIEGTPDNLVNDFVSSFTTGDLLVCGTSDTFISAVQGNGAISPMVGQTVLVQAVVTSVLPDSNAFFVQEEENDVDADSATSEGILVYNDSEFTLPKVGDVVMVKGEVSEQFNRTQITLFTTPFVCSEGAELPNVTEFTLPSASENSLETLEGMLVTAPQELVVSDNYSLGRYGEVTLSSERLFTPTNQFAPGSEEAIALDAKNKLNTVVLDDGVNGSNPETVIYPTGGLSASNSLRLGDTVASLTGVMDYSFSKYRVIPTEYPSIVASNEREAAPDLNLGNVTVASLNVLNYFTTLDQNGNKCGPNLIGCRGANTQEEFVRQKAKTVAAIVGMNADVVGLMEVENNGFGAESAIQDLTNAINAEMGEGTYAVINAGGTLGTDAIMVAMLYKPSVVSPVGAAAILDESNSISDEYGPLFDQRANRPTTAQKFALNENGEEFVVSVNHWRSKGSQCDDDTNPIPGDDDKTTGQGSCNLTRVRAAEAVLAFLADTFPEAPTLIIGDLNAYAKEDPVSTLENAGFTNLVNFFGGDQAYSYAYQGLSGYLDHALANNIALEKVVDVTEWHINADEPEVLDYNVEYKSPENVVNFYAPDAYRMSDHDPVIIALQLNVIPQDKNQCKKGGWQDLHRRDGSTFKNQGQCVSYVNTGK